MKMKEILNIIWNLIPYTIFIFGVGLFTGWFLARRYYLEMIEDILFPDKPCSKE